MNSPRLKFNGVSRRVVLMAVVVTSLLLPGCGSTRYYLKSASLMEGDPHAEIRYGENMQDGSGKISRIYYPTASGEFREDQVIDKDSLGKNAGKMAFSLTPLGMMMDALDSTELSVWVPPGKIELLIEILGKKQVPARSGDDRENWITLVSAWNHRVPVEVKAGSLYTLMNLGQLIIRSDDGKIVGRSTSDTLMELKEFNEKAFLLSKADRGLAEKAKSTASGLGVQDIPAYADTNTTLVILSGSLDLGQVVPGMVNWIPSGAMVSNVGKKPIVIDGMTLNEGEYLLNQSGKYTKAAL